MLKNEGMPGLGKDGYRGDMHVEIEVIFPSMLTTEAQELIHVALTNKNKVAHSNSDGDDIPWWDQFQEWDSTRPKGSRL